MDVAQYYVTTLTNAATKIGPVLIFLVVGYFVFIKLPFMFMVKVNKDQKPKEEPKKSPIPEIKTADEKIKLTAGNYEDRLKMAREEKERNQKRREEEKPKKEAPKKASVKLSPAEELFEFNPGDSITKGELKKRYHELLRQNHPDKVASLGSDFKKLAEKKTKEINSAYDELKKKAS